MSDEIAGSPLRKRQPTYKRQRFLLAFLRQLPAGVSVTNLQKLVFLHTMSGQSGHYDFVPYKYGSYSFQLREDLDILRRDGFVLVEEQCSSTQVRATAGFEGAGAVGGDGVKSGVGDAADLTALLDEASLLVRPPDLRIHAERGQDLIRKAYRAHPYYTIRSEIITNLFDAQEAERFRKIRQAYRKSGQALFTIGYEGRSVEQFVNQLIQHDVRLLCDVRKNPLSRKFGFSKRPLAHIVSSVGIEYVHIPELGIDSGKRRSLDKPEDYRRLFDAYRQSLPSRTVALEQVRRLLRTHERIALTCFEREPHMCHRHVVWDYLLDGSRTEGTVGGSERASATDPAAADLTDSKTHISIQEHQFAMVCESLL